MSDMTVTEQLLTAILEQIAGTRTELHHISSMLNLAMFTKYRDNPNVSNTIVHIISTGLQNLKKIDNAFCDDSEWSSQS